MSQVVFKHKNRLRFFSQAVRQQIHGLLHVFAETGFSDKSQGLHLKGVVDQLFLG